MANNAALQPGDENSYLMLVNTVGCYQKTFLGSSYLWHSQYLKLEHLSKHIHRLVTATAGVCWWEERRRCACALVRRPRALMPSGDRATQYFRVYESRIESE